MRAVSNRKFQGIWIPKEVWLSEKLTLIEKVFLVEINSLDNKDGCFASNAYFADFFGISKSRVSQIITSLAEKKYIKVDLIYKGKVVEKRVVRILKGVVNLLNEGVENIKGGYLENCEVSNTVVSNTEKNNTNKRDFDFLNVFDLPNNAEPNIEKLSSLGKDKFAELFTALWSLHPKGNPATAKQHLKQMSMTDYECLKNYIPNYVRNNAYKMNIENLITSEKWKPEYMAPDQTIPKEYKGTNEAYLEMVSKGYSWSKELNFYRA